jgi:hypothetical protein
MDLETHVPDLLEVTDIVGVQDVGIAEGPEKGGIDRGSEGNRIGLRFGTARFGINLAIEEIQCGVNKVGAMLFNPVDDPALEIDKVTLAGHGSNVQSQRQRRRRE